MEHQLWLPFICLLLSDFTTSQTWPESLSLYERYPDQAESEVCGRIRDVIPRNSGRFRRILIRNTNDQALYANDDCRRMTSRTKSKLDILASRVLATFGGNVKVRVLQAWTDQVDNSVPMSLHYEGRSVRLELSDRDRSYLGQLAGLALEAGFDWVYYANPDYIRASVIPDVCQTSVDLAFLLDESGSVGRRDFLKVIDFVKKVVDFFNIGDKGTHIAVVTYSSGTQKHFDLVRYYTKSELRNAVNKISYKGGSTNTGEALDYVRLNIFNPSRGMRTDPGIPKVLVLITDGRSNGKPVLDPADTLRNEGVNIFSIGVGNRVRQSELNQIASDPDEDYVFRLSSFNDLSSWVERLSSVSCSEGSLIKSCESSVTDVTSGSFKYFRTEFSFVTNNKVSVEVRDLEGISHLYASSTSRNPGPLDPGSVKNENDRSPRAVTVKLDGTKTVYVAVQGQKETNRFSLSFWDNLFSKNQFVTTVREGQSARLVTQLSMLPNQNSLVYKITDGNSDGFFRIETNIPKLWTTKELDREKVAQYNLVVVAENTLNKCHKSRILVVVNVEDVNDNFPVFTENPYRAAIKENAQIGKVVKTVKATDKDSGLNGQINYRIASGNSGNLFRINNGGQVILLGSLNYESTPSYTLKIEAQDGGNPSKTGVTELRITVVDVNESPSISCDSSCSLRVREDAVPGTKVGKVTGTDPDRSSNCALQYDILSNTQDTFGVSTNGDIQTRKGLDRESTPQYVFIVRVRDCAAPPLTDSVRVTVTIEDVNDNKPTFDGPYSVSILENEVIGSDIVQVKANDADEGKNAEITYSLYGTDSSTFQIDAASGRIKTRTKMDYETKKLYSFNVTATDNGKNRLTGTTVVTVDVMDVNDQQPKFTGLPYIAQVLEGSSPGTQVFTVTATDGDSGIYGKVTYSIISGNVGNAFAIDSNSGQITVNSALDREIRSSYRVTVQASDQGSPPLSTQATITVTVLDVNDNSPVFQGLPYTASVSENVAADHLILKVSATDKDSGSFGQVQYSIKSPAIVRQTFRIDRNGDVRLEKKLDYETEKRYSFTITATDGGGKTADAVVDVSVEDYNDNPPVFDRNSYSASVPENVNIGSPVGTVRATDKDSGPRGRVMYSITNGNVGNAFVISSSGTVTVTSSLDRETLETYSLTIKATDDGSPQLSSITTMAITVTDVNDNAPTFPKSSYSFNITENNSPDYEVGRVGPAQDKDKGPNAEIVYSIVSGNPGGRFDFRATGELIAKSILDREVISSYSLVIQAKDKGSPALVTQVPVNVIVQDENDNAPVFSKNSYNCQISENSAPNSPVCFVRASDKDVGNNGAVTYELVTPSSTFSVNQRNGEIKAKVTLDREAKEIYTFKVRAKDGGSPPKSSEVNITVEVIDKNDNEPRFNQSTYKFDVSENAAVSTSVGRVFAEDNDKGLNGQVLYSITGGNTNSAFNIDQTSGNIQVQSLLDRETLASYRLTVQAMDHGTSPLFSSRVVSINVKDFNDNSPIFTKSLYHGLVAEDASVGSAVAQVKANDADEGINAEITYSITGGQNKNHFTIEENSGVIRTAKALDYETINVYTLDVTATDRGSPSLSNTSRVNITITNTNDNVPTFVIGSSQISVSEAVAIETKVLKFNATDKDGSKLTFSIFSGNVNDAFKLDNQTGVLTINKKLDRETIPRYNLSVTVTDTGNQSSSQNLSVIVLDVNDNTPIFEPSSYRVNVTENTAAGSIVMVKATDKDEGMNARISFSIDPISAKKFSIDSTTGEISTKVPLDREVDSQYVIQVTARDAGTPSLFSVATVEVTVIDRNDNSPNFANDYNTSLPENTARGRTVLRVEATDPDLGVNGEIEYSIVSGDSLGFFSVNSKDGNLKLEKSPDRETIPSFTLTVLAKNKVPVAISSPTTKTRCTVVITIEDINDNAPEILNNASTVSIPENSNSSTLVLDVEATDKDTGLNSEIQYEIVSGNVLDVFAIDRGNGRVTVKGLLDREVRESYKLKIRASDKGTPSLSSEKDFTVDVIDEDDNPPVFTRSSYDASISENARVSSFVIQIKATDKDTGRNGNITYSLTSGNDLGHFTIDSVSGNVTTKALLDYEIIKNYTLVITARDTKHSVQTNLLIRVVDVNDNNPVFNPARYTVNIPENYTLDNEFLTLKATDKDPFGGLMYIIESGNNENKFALDPSKGSISVTAKLDRETTDFYNLTVRVNDGGVPVLSSIGFVEIHVTDNNDNAPKFNMSSVQVKVKENTLIREAVFTVYATDQDLGVNAELRYYISKGNEQSKFKLDQNSGVLSVNENIDRETISNFRLEIVAEDLGSPSLRSEALVVEIEVLDENDNDPEFRKNIYYPNITENLSGGTFVQEVEATDKDIGLNGKVVYSIKSGARGHFTIGNETGIVETTGPLDRENIPSYSLVIEAKDLGSPSRNSTTILSINVLDANDNAPRFVLSSLRGNVTEGKPIEQFVTRIVAVDQDEGLGSQIEYKLATNMLKIDPKTGEIRTLVEFDYEQQQNHTFKVTASDKGNPSLSTTADLIVNVFDIDDNCPVFNPKEYSVTIKENLPLNYTIVRVSATDKDSVDNQGLVYGIRQGNQAGNFRMNATTGDISPIKFVDREFSSVYKLIVRAGSDYCGVSRNISNIDETSQDQLSKSTADVTIYVTDVNDNAPVFHEPSYNYVFSDIYASNLLALNATDPDVGENAKVDFSLATVERDRSVRTLSVAATDRGVPQQSSNTTLVVTMAQGVNCEAMLFDVSPRGQVTVKTLCIFSPFKKIDNAIVGKTIQLDCEAQGNTIPEYRWTRNSVPVTDWTQSGTHVIKSLSKDDAGEYACIATSEAGTILSDPIEVIVEEPPTIILQPQNTSAELGKRAVLSCEAKGDRPIEYSWYKNGKLLFSSGGLITNKRDLVFGEVIPQDAGEYHCEAKNRARKEPARSRKARLQVFSADAVIEMDVRVDKPRYEESCQYFDIKNLKDTLQGVLNATVAVTEFVKPNRTCNVTHCSSNPCQNQGTCQPLESGFLCQCPRGWRGNLCEIDVDECKTESCGGNGTCHNRNGSYSCSCPKGTRGKRCQLSDAICQSNPCQSNETCYPKESVKGYECLGSVQTVSMVFKLDQSRRPWEDWMKYDVQREIKNTIINSENTVSRQGVPGNRRRRNAVNPDYGECSVLINTIKVRESEVELDVVLVCVNPPSKNYVCDALFSEGKVSSCTTDGGIVTETPPTKRPNMETVSFTVVFVARQLNGKAMEATSAIKILQESDIDSKLKRYGITPLAYRARSLKKANRDESAKLSAGAIAGVTLSVIVILIVAIAISFVILRARSRRGKKFNIRGRAVLSRTQSNDAILKREITMEEFRNLETRKIKNKTFSEIYEESHSETSELDDGAFMVDNPQLSYRKHDREYMAEIETSPWYHGSITRSKAEDILNEGGSEGLFIVRRGLDEGEFYISVIAPEGGPKVRHIAVNRREDSFVAVCGPFADAVAFSTFHELVEYLRSTPTHFEGIASDLLLKDYVEKT